MPSFVCLSESNLSRKWLSVFKSIHSGHEHQAKFDFNVTRHLSLITDIDECASPETNECDSNAVCNNTEGSYTCRCQNGYQGDGKSCAGNFFLCAFFNTVFHPPFYFQLSVFF